MGNQDLQNLSLANAITSVAATITYATGAGSIVPGLGNIAGFVVGVGMALTNVAESLLGAQEQLKQIKRAEFYDQIKQYDQTIFGAALSRMAPAMEDIVNLGIKPGTAEFDYQLVQKLGSQIGYKGNCNIDLYTPSAAGDKQLLASIDQNGVVLLGPGQNSQFFDFSNGAKWAQACKKVYLASLQMWASNQKDSIEYQQLLQQQQAQAQQIMLTSIMVSTGMGMLLVGFILRQQGKMGYRV